MSSTGMRKVQVSEVSGFTALPSPEFWNIATAAQAAELGAGGDGDGIALVGGADVAQRAERRSRDCRFRMWLMNGVRYEHGTPV